LAYYGIGKGIVARTSPGEFIRQVRAETAKVVWPSSRETVMTTIMVMIMTTVLGVFFFSVDSAFAAIVKSLLKLID
jgi:preprotein translocase subunit SecE